MADIELTDRQRKVSDFRFGIIADLVYTHADRAELARLIAEKAARVYEIPFSGKTTITASCIRKWLATFRSRGREALIPKSRKDKGRCRVLSDGEKELILKRLEEKPSLYATVVVRMLQREGKLEKGISKSSLSRFIRSSGFERIIRLREAPKDQILRFGFDHPLECVQADAMHSFLVPDHRGKLRTAILIAFIDDATRRIVYSRFSFTENALEFERGILHILRAHGRIKRLYTDNGSTFVSNQTRRILDTLGIIIVHSRPGIPKGRGKIERFFRTVRSQFEAIIDPSSVRSIQDYDTRFRTWLESEYHRAGHTGLGGRTPLDAWLTGTGHIFRLDQSIDLEEVFCHEEPRKVDNDATVSLAGVIYEVPSVLVGTRVKLRLNPHENVPIVRVFQDGKDYGSARRVDEYANARTRRIMGSDDPSQAALRSSAAGE